MITANNFHPMVRYGIAAALVRFPELDTDIKKRTDLWQLAKVALEDAMNRLIYAPQTAADGISINYSYLGVSQLKSRKNAANGYFIAPHVLSSQNAADIIKEAEKLIALLSKKDEGKNYELKRSFAPMIAKRNAGKKSMSNPKIDILEAAFTCMASMTHFKPAAFVKSLGDKFANAGIIPDLPLVDEATGERPLVEFVENFKEVISGGVGENSISAKPTKEKKFPRPDIFFGNYPNRPKTYGLGVVSLVAAIGKWAKEHQIYYGNTHQVLALLQDKPIYIVSYNGTNQERYGHHLVGLAMSGELHNILNKLPKVGLIGVDDGRKFSDPKWQLFIRSFDHFLRFFNEAAWRNFLAHRATYPSEFFQIIKSYFMQSGKYSEEIINAAIAYGKSLNKTAFIAATEELARDKKKEHDGRSLKEYKYRTLLQLESIINSAENGTELVSRLNSQVGRLTMRDISVDAEPFLKAVANDTINIEDARHLITAFMRLSTYQTNKNGDVNTTDTLQETQNTEEEELSFLG